MELIKQSCILHLICSFFKWLEDAISESAFCTVVVGRWIMPIWRAIDKKWNESFCMALLRKIGAVFKSGWSYAFFVRKPALDRMIEESCIIRAALWCANLIPNLLSRLRRRFAVIDGSVLIPVCDYLPHAVLCVLTVVLLVTPQEMWDNMYSLLIAAAALAAFWFSGMRNEDRRLSLRGIGGWTAVFFCVTILSTLWSIDPSASLRFAFFHITALIVLVVLVCLIRNEREVLAVVFCIAVGLAIASAYAVLQRIQGVETSSSLTDLSANKGMPGRVYSFFENPNSFANILVLFAPLMLTMGLDKKHKVCSIFFLIAFVLSMLALIMTYSRGGWLAIAFSVFVLILLVKPAYAPLLIVVGCAALPILPDTILNRILTIFTGDSSIDARMHLYDGAFGAIATNPVLGVGLGSDVVSIAAEESGRYLIAEKMEFVHAHNLYFQIWAESGAVGLVSFLLAMFYGLQRASSGARREGAPMTARRVCAGFVAAFAGIMFFGLTDYPWCYPRVLVMYWLAFALMCASAKLCENEIETKEI